jgi:hypothetical protein
VRAYVSSSERAISKKKKVKPAIAPRRRIKHFLLTFLHAFFHLLKLEIIFGSRSASIERPGGMKDLAQFHPKRREACSFVQSNKLEKNFLLLSFLLYKLSAKLHYYCTKRESKQAERKGIN